MNRDDPQRPRPLVRSLLGKRFTVYPDSPETVEVGGEPADVAAVNAAVLERLAQQSDPLYEPPLLKWVVLGDGAAVTPSADAPTTGIYVTSLSSGGVTGTPYRVELRRGDALLGRSADIDVEVSSAAGPAANGTPVEWSTVHGTLPAETTLENGHARGIWLAFEKPGEPVFRVVQVYATVGRARDGIAFDRRTLEAVSSSPTLGHEQLMADRTSPFVLYAADGTEVIAVRFRGSFRRGSSIAS